MTIAYLIDYDINSNSGVLTKIVQQSKQWVLKGHRVYYVSTKTLAIYDSNKNLISQLKPLKIGFKRVGTAIKLLHSSYYLDKLLKNIDFDILYMRYRLFMPFFTKILKKYKVIMEINSDDTLEYKLHSNLTHIYNKYTRNLVLKHIDTFISVSNELKDKFIFLNKPIYVIANGIDTSKYIVSKNQNHKPRLVFIGTPNQSWHGIDKIIDMANFIKEFEFYIIGTKGIDTDNLKYFGYLSERESAKIIQQCDVGIGTLSIYKKGLNEASPLKSRQYLACGLPIIYAYKDTDLKGDENFTLFLENSKDNIDLEKIKQFVYKVYQNNKIQDSAREFAKDILDYEKKENTRLSIFQKVLDEK